MSKSEHTAQQPLQDPSRLDGHTLYSVRYDMAKALAERLLLEEVAVRISNCPELRPMMADGTPVKTFYEDNPDIVDGMMYDTFSHNLHRASASTEHYVETLRRLLKHSLTENERHDFIENFENVTNRKMPENLITSESDADTKSFGEIFKNAVASGSDRQKITLKGTIDAGALEMRKPDAVSSRDEMNGSDPRTDPLSPARFLKLWKKISVGLKPDNWLKSNFENILICVRPEDVPSLMEAGIVLRNLSNEDRDVLRQELQKKIKKALSGINLNETDWPLTVRNAMCIPEAAVYDSLNSVRNQELDALTVEKPFLRSNKTLSPGKPHRGTVIDAKTDKLTTNPSLTAAAEPTPGALHHALMVEIYNREQESKFGGRIVLNTSPQR